MASRFTSRRFAGLLTVLALGAATSSTFAQSREYQRGYEAGFRDGAASVHGGAGRPPGPPGQPGWQIGRLVILEAWFGLRSGPSCDARGVVQNIVDGRGANEVYASTRLCGDPAPNRPKQLMVSFRCDNRAPVRLIANEGQVMRFPC